MTAETGKTDKSAVPPQTPAASPNGLGITSDEWVTQARFIAFQEPKPWKIEGREGITYKIDVAIAEGTAFVKIDEKMFRAMADEKLQFGDKIKIIWDKAVRSGELRPLPISWTRI